MSDYFVSALKDSINELERFQKSFKSIKSQWNFKSPEIQQGLEISKLACAQKETVFATPLMKNLLVALGDVTETEQGTEKLKAGKESKAVAWINDVVLKCLRKYNGEKREQYDHNLPVDSVELYNTDCWLGWNIEKFWDIKPGQALEREKTFQKYSSEKTNFSLQQMKNLISKDKIFVGACKYFCDTWPKVKAVWEVRKINDPFMSKKTGVSYPYFRNDSSKVPGKNITFGEQCIHDVEKAFSKGIDYVIKFTANNNIYTGYPRNQRGKGRALEAQSRIVNLVINTLNGPEMEEVKHSKYGGGLIPSQELKQWLINIAEFVLKHPEYIAMNKDFSAWDTTVGSGWVYLQNALRMINTNGSNSRIICKLRNACVIESHLINGPAGKVQKLYGRTPSGYIDTTLQNTAINAILTEYANRRVDPDYSSKVTYPMRGKNILTLGDDYLGITLKGYEEKWVEITKELGFSAHADFKDAFGVMFIQYRLFKDQEGKWVMAYNWPRVLRSMLSKEDQKGLGEGGWTLAFYQQLGKLIEYPQSLMIASNIAAALDKNHLYLDKSINEIIKMVKEEDDARISKGVKDRKAKLQRSLTTAEKLSNNPMLPGIKDNNGIMEIDENYFETIQNAIKSVYDSQFLTKLGVALPENFSK